MKELTTAQRTALQELIAYVDETEQDSYNEIAQDDPDRTAHVYAHAQVAQTILDTDTARPPVSITIHYSETNDGYMYNVYRADLSDTEIDHSMTDSEDGGLCTGTLEDAIEMASAAAIALVNKDITTTTI